MEQVIGRARRICSHQELPEDMRTVKVFLYLSVLSEEQKTSKNNIELRIRDVSKKDRKTPFTTDESLFEIASIKDKTNKTILKAVKETAIDCPLNYHANIFPEEVEKYKNCIDAKEYQKLTEKQKSKVTLCPAACDFQNCSYKCSNKKLNKEFFDENMKVTTDSIKELCKGEILQSFNLLLLVLSPKLGGIPGVLSNPSIKLFILFTR
jgi:hypothetical protein